MNLKNYQKVNHFFLNYDIFLRLVWQKVAQKWKKTSKKS